MATIKGKWKWKEVISDLTDMNVSEERDYIISFTSNGEKYAGIGLFTSATNSMPTGIRYNSIANPGTWRDYVKIRILQVN